MLLPSGENDHDFEVSWIQIINHFVLTFVHWKFCILLVFVVFLYLFQCTCTHTYTHTSLALALPLSLPLSLSRSRCSSLHAPAGVEYTGKNSRITWYYLFVYIYIHIPHSLSCLIQNIDQKTNTKQVQEPSYLRQQPREDNSAVKRCLKQQGPGNLHSSPQRASLCRKNVCPKAVFSAVARSSNSRISQHISYWTHVGPCGDDFHFVLTICCAMGVPMLLSNEVLVAQMARCWLLSGLLWRLLRQNAPIFYVAIFSNVNRQDHTSWDITKHLI
jgi:hypothetical protein